jgi:signal peptidase II
MRQRIAELMKKRPALRYGIVAAIAACLACIAIDQLSKSLILGSSAIQAGEQVTVIPGMVHFRLAWNDGINFGLFSGGGEVTRIILSIVMCIAGAALIAASLACRRWFSTVALGIAAGGALGNAIDRLVHGRVADFLNTTCCGIVNPWYYNIADVFVFLGFGLLILSGNRKKPAGETQAG